MSSLSVERLEAIHLHYTRYNREFLEERLVTAEVEPPICARNGIKTTQYAAHLLFTSLNMNFRSSKRQSLNSPASEIFGQVPALRWDPCIIHHYMI